MGASDGLTLRYIARRMAFPKQTVNSAVAKMQDDGLVTLESAEGSHKEKSVRLTDTGRRAEDSRMAGFGEPPIVVNYFYHEQVKQSARGDLPFR